MSCGPHEVRAGVRHLPFAETIRWAKHRSRKECNCQCLYSTEPSSLSPLLMAAGKANAQSRLYWIEISFETDDARGALLRSSECRPDLQD